MKRTMLSAFTAVALLLAAAANAPAAGQTYNPYITVDAPDLSKKRGKRAKQTQSGTQSGARSSHSGGANFMLMDGSVRFVRPGLGGDRRAISGSQKAGKARPRRSIHTKDWTNPRPGDAGAP